MRLIFLYEHRDGVSSTAGRLFPRNFFRLKRARFTLFPLYTKTVLIISMLRRAGFQSHPSKHNHAQMGDTRIALRQCYTHCYVKFDAGSRIWGRVIVTLIESATWSG